MDEVRKGGKNVLVHICGVCHGLHLETPEGTLRRPTVAERFRIEMQLGSVIDLAKGRPANQAGATLFLPKEKS